MVEIKVIVINFNLKIASKDKTELVIKLLIKMIVCCQPTFTLCNQQDTRSVSSTPDNHLHLMTIYDVNAIEI